MALATRTAAYPTLTAADAGFEASPPDVVEEPSISRGRHSYLGRAPPLDLERSRRLKANLAAVVATTTVRGPNISGFAENGRHSEIIISIIIF
jgi:hypothetical protein